MDKAQALNHFWSSFGLPAYDENTVPDDAHTPYITYNTVTDSLDSPVPVSGSIWYHGTSWAPVEQKKAEIANALDMVLPVGNREYLWLTKGTPFASRVADSSDQNMRRIYINIMAEYLTAK